MQNITIPKARSQHKLYIYHVRTVWKEKECINHNKTGHFTTDEPQVKGHKYIEAMHNTAHPQELGAYQIELVYKKFHQEVEQLEDLKKWLKTE